MKLLLYCVKAKPYLQVHPFDLTNSTFRLSDDNFNKLNGKIVAECDYEVEKIELKSNYCEAWFETKTLNEERLREKSCLRLDSLYNYLGSNDCGYAIHIKNLHIFDVPKELSDYESFAGYKKYYLINDFVKLEKAPQNMCKVLKPYIRFNRDFKAYEDFDILISIHPEWLCKILNGEKTIEVRKKVLKEMLK